MRNHAYVKDEKLCDAVDPVLFSRCILTAGHEGFHADQYGRMWTELEGAERCDIYQAD